MVIGTSKPIVLEKWQQSKKTGGSLGDTLIQRYTAYAEIEKREYAQDGRQYQNSQTKESEVYKMKLRCPIDSNGRPALEVDALWKVVYKGKRHTVLSKKRISEKNFYYQLTVEVK